MSTEENLIRSLKEIFIDEKNIDYIIPFYQRNFSWGEEHIYQLMQDIYTSYYKNKDSNYFIGTLVTIKREDTNTYEVIDGQQRLTALSLILRYMIDDDNMQVKIKYDARDSVTKFLENYYKNTSAVILPEVPHPFDTAVHAIKNLKLIDTDNNDTTVDINTLKNDEGFINYLKDNVKIVRVEMPSTTDIETYFEIMNNRGEQLKQHEIIKVKVIEKLNSKSATKYAEIWDACSQMDVYIQKKFEKLDRETLFGTQYDEICSYDKFKEFLRTDVKTHKQKSNDINSILNDKISEQIKDNKHEYHVASNAIIDFPNFLMQVFKLYDTEIPLNDNNMLDKDNNNNIKVLNTIKDPVRFLYHLLYCRTFFDRYIVRSIEENGKNIWMLQKPTKYDDTWNYINTFNDKESDHIIKTLSMLQVTFRTKIYKNWLNLILSKYCNKNLESSITTLEDTIKINLNVDEYIQFLESNIINPYYEDNFSELMGKIDTYAEGTKTPHFLFNFINYLYWLENKSQRSKEIKDFDFKYHNSIEHHLSQHHSHSQNIGKECLDYLGNLCLVSRSDNSSMSDHSPEDKSKRKLSDSLPPKQQIMYQMTSDSGKWEDEEIKQHQNDIKILLSKKDSLISINKTPVI